MSIYDISISSIGGQENMLSLLNSKVSMFINITTKCGYTPKCSNLWSYARTSRTLWDLQILHEMYSGRGFSVVGVPCNQFGGQEPATNREIARFVDENYPFVKFPITEKIEVNGPNEHELYTALKGTQRRRRDDNMANGSIEAQNGQNLANQALARIPHNGEKFIVGRDGNVLMRFGWAEKPLSDEPLTIAASWTIKEAINEILG